VSIKILRFERERLHLLRSGNLRSSSEQQVAYKLINLPRNEKIICPNLFNRAMKIQTNRFSAKLKVKFLQINDQYNILTLRLFYVLHLNSFLAIHAK
jgi:hypothetical protein